MLDSDDLPQPDQEAVYDSAMQQAQETGLATFKALEAKYIENMAQEKEKAEYGFKARERAIERIGLPEVKAHRLNKLEEEKKQWLSGFSERQKIRPQLNALLVLRIKPKRQDQ